MSSVLLFADYHQRVPFSCPLKCYGLLAASHSRQLQQNQIIRVAANGDDLLMRPSTNWRLEAHQDSIRVFSVYQFFMLDRPE